MADCIAVDLVDEIVFVADGIDEEIGVYVATTGKLANDGVLVRGVRPFDVLRGCSSNAVFLRVRPPYGSEIHDPRSIGSLIDVWCPNASVRRLLRPPWQRGKSVISIM
jgi:hypothetical protein